MVRGLLRGSRREGGVTSLWKLLLLFNWSQGVRLVTMTTELKWFSRIFGQCGFKVQFVHLSMAGCAH